MKYIYTVLKPFLYAIIIAHNCHAQHQDTYTFNLKSAQAYAAKHNYNAIKSERDIEKTSQRIWEIIADGLPQISAKVDYKNFINQPGSLVPSSAFDPVPKIIETAKEYFGLDPSKKYTPPSDYINLQMGQPQTLEASITLEQKLFDGDFIVSFQSREVLRNTAKYAKSKTLLDIKESVMNSYGGVLISKESLKILEEQRKITSKNLHDTKRSFESGLLKDEDIKQLELSLKDLENQINKAKQQVKTAINLFKYILGIDIYTPSTIKFEDTIETFITSSITSDNPTTKNNFDYSKLIDYKNQENTVRTQELLLKSEKFKHLPSLSAFLTQSQTGSSEDINFFKEEATWQNSTVLGISLSIPVFSSFGRYAKVQQAKIDLDKSNVDLINIKNKLKLDYDNAKIDHNFAKQQFHNAASSMKLSQYILERTHEKFKVGTASSFELYTAQNQLMLRQQNYLQSLSELVRTKAQLYKILNL